MSQYNPKSTFDVPKGVTDPAMRAVLQDWANKLHAEHQQISRTMNAGGTVIILGTGSGSTASTASAGISASNVKSGTASVTANTIAVITFPVVFTTIPTVAICWLAGADGSFGVINTRNLTITTSNFTIPAADIIQNGYIFYIATVNA